MEFIENVEGFYNGITFLKRALLDARIKKDEKKEKEMISEMESYLFHLKQFLGTIMERKGNIVDLSKIWKDGKKEKPLPYSDIVVRDCCISSNDEDVLGESQWAYLEDLLPKGGE